MTESAQPFYYRKVEPVEGCGEFWLRFNLRHYGHVVNCPLNGATWETVNEFSSALSPFYATLVGESMGWAPLESNFRREVVLCDLGPGTDGLASIEGRKKPYLVFNPRTFYAHPETRNERRRATVAHELVHLLQFETPLFRHWYERSSFANKDRNWWLHEATALAYEYLLLNRTNFVFPRLWDWVTQPHVSLESDLVGYRALPFLIFMMDRLGPSFLSRMYQTTVQTSETLWAGDVLSLAISEASTHGPTSLADMFMAFCVDMVNPTESASKLTRQIREVVGNRSWSDRFEHYPVTNSSRDCPVDHLGCRYFHFKPNSNHGSLTITVHPLYEQGRPVANATLKAALLIVSQSSEVSTTVPLTWVNGNFVASLPHFDQQSIKEVILVVANIAYGNGWALHDQAKFSIQANVT